VRFPANSGENITPIFETADALSGARSLIVGMEHIENVRLESMVLGTSARARHVHSVASSRNHLMFSVPVLAERT
jgi:hypothetical protein